MIKNKKTKTNKNRKKLGIAQRRVLDQVRTDLAKIQEAESAYRSGFAARSAPENIHKGFQFSTAVRIRMLKTIDE